MGNVILMGQMHRYLGKVEREDGTEVLGGYVRGYVGG